MILGIKSYTFSLQVAAIYKDSSIGNLINIVIVKLVIIHDEQVRNSSKTNIPSCSRLLGGIYVCRTWNGIIEKHVKNLDSERNEVDFFRHDGNEMTTEEATASNKQFKKLRLKTIRYSLFISLLLDLKYDHF